MSIDADILIVDDQPSDLRFLSDLLENEGYKVRPVENDRSTIDSALLKSPDLIILNAHMPGMDGFEVCQHLKQKKQTEHIPKIFISAVNDTETRIRGFEAGCVDFISKPFQEQEVLARVNTQLGLHKLKLNLEKLVEERTADLSKSKAALEHKIVEVKKAEEELRISEERHELAVSGSEVGIWDYNFKTDKSYYSDRFKELMGYDSQELENLTLEEALSHLHPDFPEKLKIALQDHLDGNSPFYFIDYKVRMKSGEYRWFQARGKVAWDDQGQPIRVAGSFIDIHEQKTAEEKIRKSERHFRHLMESTPLAIAIFEPDGKINQVNDAWKKLWRLSEQEAAQVIAEYNFITDKQVEDLGVSPLVKRAFEGESIILPPITYQGATTTNELGLEEIESQSRIIQSHLHSVKDAKGDIEHVVAINMDLTNLKKVEREAEAQRESLARMDRTSSMGQLTASIAHELNQPLTGILSNAQAAEMLINNKSWTTEDLREIMSAIVSDTKRASSVIRNLREMYRDHLNESFPFGINEIASQTLQLLNSELIGNNIHLATNLDPTAPKAEGNIVQIQQVVVNLIMNAIQAVMHLEKVDRQLGIVTESEENEIKVWIKDNGPGIDTDKIDHIFEPFATWRAGGTGMGLAISNSIITAHGGSMWAENLVEGGCRVGFILPVSNEDNNT